MKRSDFVVLAVATFFLSCQDPAPLKEEAAAVPKKDGVFIHISHGTSDPHRVLMGLRMASVMSSDKDVLVYFDIEGVEVVLEETQELDLAPFESSRVQLQALLDSGVTVCVCPSCLAAAGKTPEEVIEGVQIAKREAFFDFTEGRILTIDY
jgi:predicted peroxiredoxin